MIELVGLLVAIGFFGLITQKSVLGALLGLQVMSMGALLGLVIFSSQAGMPMSVAANAQSAALVFLVLFQVQSVASLAYVTRMHYLKVKTKMRQLGTMRN